MQKEAQIKTIMKRCLINEKEMNERFHFLIGKIIVALFVSRPTIDIGKERF